MSRGDGVVGGPSWEWQRGLDLFSTADLSKEGDEAGDAIKWRHRLGDFFRNELGSVEERDRLDRGGLVRWQCFVLHSCLLPQLVPSLSPCHYFRV